MRAQQRGDIRPFAAVAGLIVQQQIVADIGHPFEHVQLPVELQHEWATWALGAAVADLAYARYLVTLTRWNFESIKFVGQRFVRGTWNNQYWDEFQDTLEQQYWGENHIQFRDVYVILDSMPRARQAALLSGA